MELPAAMGDSETARMHERAEALELRVRQLAYIEYGFYLWLGLFALGAVLLLAWVFWPRKRALTSKGFVDLADGIPAGLHVERHTVGIIGGVLVLMLFAITQQLRVDAHRGFIDDQTARMERELREATAHARQEVLDEAHPTAAQLADAGFQARIKKAEAAARQVIVDSHYLYQPSAPFLRKIFLNNDSVAADYVWLTSLQYVSSPFRRGQKADLMVKFYDTILELDPHWVGALETSGRLLSALESSRTRAEAFFNRAITHNPDDYRLPFQAGLHYVVPPLDPKQLPEYSEKAAFFLTMAMKRKSTPPEMEHGLKDLIGRLSTEAGQYQAASDTLWGVANDANAQEQLRINASREWLFADSLLRASKWQDAVKEFKQRFGRFPQSLGETRQYVLEGSNSPWPAWFGPSQKGRDPIDAYGYAITYNPPTGKVDSRGAQCARAIQTHYVIESLIELFHNEPENLRNPADMQELSAWGRAYYQRIGGAPAPITQALGLEIDCTASPLGGSWDYNPLTGELILPPDCEVSKLYANKAAALEGRRPPYFK